MVLALNSFCVRLAVACRHTHNSIVLPLVFMCMGHGIRGILLRFVSVEMIDQCNQIVALHSNWTAVVGYHTVL